MYTYQKKFSSFFNDSPFLRTHTRGIWIPKHENRPATGGRHAYILIKSPSTFPFVARRRVSVVDAPFIHTMSGWRRAPEERKACVDKSAWHRRVFPAWFALVVRFRFVAFPLFYIIFLFLYVCMHRYDLSRKLARYGWTLRNGDLILCTQ